MRVELKVTPEKIFKEALAAVEGIEHEQVRIQLLEEIAVEMARAGLYREALGVAQKLGRPSVIKKVVAEMIKTGLHEEALEVAREIDDKIGKVALLGAIAVGMAKNCLLYTSPSPRD